MRVAFFVNNYAPSRGGVQEHVGRIAEGLVARHGLHVEVLTSDALLAPAGPDPGHIERRDERLGGVEVHRRPVARRLHGALRTLRRVGRRLHVYEPNRNTLLISGPLGLRLARSARELAARSDVVVGVGAPSASLWAAGVLTKSTDAAVVAMPLVHLDDETPRRWVLRVVRGADAVSANSSPERDWLVARGVTPSRIEVLPPGCDPEDYPDVSPSEARARLSLDDAPTVGFIGRLAPHKGVDTLLLSMRRVWVDRPETRLLVAGHAAGWDLTAALGGLDAGERAKVRVWGGFTDEERAWLYAACDVVAHPSRSESFGMATIEAWCARRAVVVGDIEVTRTLVHDGIDGDLVEPGDAAALADRLSALLADARLRAAYGRAGRAAAESGYAWSAIVDRWADLLGAAVEQRSDARRSGAGRPVAEGGA